MFRADRNGNVTMDAECPDDLMLRQMAHDAIQMKLRKDKEVLEQKEDAVEFCQEELDEAADKCAMYIMEPQEPQEEAGAARRSGAQQRQERTRPQS